jgi:large subunit ribosomal protein L3
MRKAIIGKKIGMTQIFNENGAFVPITVIDTSSCVVSTLKTLERDGYSAVQMGYGVPKLKNVKKPLRISFEKLGIEPKKVLHEFRIEGLDFKVGDIVKPDIFKVGELVDVCGISKGKGYAGVIKRWNFRRLRETHGSGPVVRHGGSIGMCSDPSRVFKGKKMAGRLGSERKTVQNLEIVRIDSENNIIAVKGAVPGPKNGVLYIITSIKTRAKEGI